MKKTFRMLLSIFLTASMFFGIFPLPVSDAEGGSTDRTGSAKQTVRDRQDLLEKNYSDMLREWSKIPVSGDTNIVIQPGSDPANQKWIVPSSESFGYSSDTVRFQKGAEMTVRVEVEQTGLYQIGFDYFISDDSILPAEGSILVNRQYPFYESRRILFSNLWQDQALNEKYDRYGNELLPRPVKIKAWQHAYAMDASYLYMEPLKYKLEKGVNTLTFVNTGGDLLLGNLTVNSPSDIESYEAYSKRQPAAERNESSDSLIVIEAENPIFKNDSSIRALSDNEPNLTPYDTKHRLLNVLGGFSWEDGGQAVAWEMEAPRDGFYKIALKYRQNFLHDMPVFRKIEIDGKVPFREVENYAFPYGKKWNNEVLGANGKPFEFFLTKGTHTLTMTVSLDPVRPLSQEIVSRLKEINRLTLQIKKLTGNRTDLYRDWNLSEYIPDLDKTLSAWADRLEAQYDELNLLNPDVGEIGELANLKMAVNQLRTLAKEPEKLPNRMALFSDGSSSVSQLLGDLLQRITESPLELDKIYVYRHGKVPKPNAGFWIKTVELVKRFFLSFTGESYSASAKSNSELNVWVNRPRGFVELMQKMIDEEFTPETGIAVKLSIMPDQYKLVLANASGSQPDAALGVDNWIPYDLAIRNSVVDLRKFDDFDQVIGQFSKGAIIPFSYENGVYALPETQDFWVLFYRKDILNSLQLDVPDTWDDVVKMLPELQRLGMNFYEPLALYKGFKPFSATTPFIYQFGGELFTGDGMKTAIDREPSLEGIKFMTDLYTIYNLPQDVPNFYQHFRYGTMPIGISNFTTYIQLKSAAPEIANEWKIAPHPGVERDGMVQRWASSGGQTGMIFKGTAYERQSWQFLKWWLSADVQVRFASLMQTTFGPTFMWNTANLHAFAQIPWPEEDKKVILEQNEWIREASRVPGAYMVEREISNVWNRVVFDGDNPRNAIDDAVIRTNREIVRKMEEFGFYENGKMVKPYPVPTINTIDRWIEKR